MTSAKRCFDLVTTALGLLVLWPVYVVIALAIRLDDGGPALFRQVRVGRNGRRFKMWKFRTMRAHEGNNGNGAGSLLTVGTDPRITRVGYWLRRFKLDELPQVIHVLAGDMSLVGPRPEVERYVALYSPDQGRVLAMTPGITDPASIRYWDESDLLAQSSDPERTYITDIMPEKIRIQLDYGHHATVWTDFLVLLGTLRRLWPTVRPVLYDRLVRYRRPLIIVTHLLLVVLGYWLAFAVRFDFDIPPREMTLFWRTLPLLVGLRLLLYGRFGVYRGYWQHFGIADLVKLCQAATASSVLFAAACIAFGWLPGLSRGVLLIDWVGAIFLAGGVRLAARWLRETRGTLARVTGRRTLVVGEGDQAERFLRELRRDARRPLNVVGLAVDQVTGRGRSIHGVPVVGTLDDLGALAKRYRIELIVIALDAATGHQMQAVVERCTATGVEFKTLPSLGEVLDGAPPLDQLRNVEIHDLLGRAPVGLDLTRVAAELHGAVVLVTGAAGSIGSELARQIARAGPARLVLVDQAESPLFFVHLELTEAHPRLDIVAVIADITDSGAVERVFLEHRPYYVVHAAAYKHVPMLESNVREAAWNNVVGTLQMAECASRHGTAKFVLISTDKAVHPSSVMGATKRVAERVVLGLPALRAATTDFRVVRFGNVLGSSGSVLPLFERQLAGGGPLTVTHPSAERYFMTIPEAAQLVLCAAALPEAADRVTMLDMGEPVRIVELAEKLIRLSGRIPYRDVSIVFTGLRPGEKLYETLTGGSERVAPTSMPKINVVELEEDDGEAIEAMLSALVVTLHDGDAAAVRQRICAMVPEALPPLAHGAAAPAAGNGRRPHAEVPVEV